MTTINDILAQIPDITLENKMRFDAEAKLEKRNIPKVIMVDTNEEPKYPTNVTELSSDGLGKLYSTFMAWTGYYRYLVNLKDADILLCKNTSSMFKKVLINNLGGEVKTGQKKEYVECNENILGLEKLLTQLEIEQKVVEARYYFYDNCSKALSREISRRDSEAEKTYLST